MAETITFRSAVMEGGRFIVDVPVSQRGAVMHWLRSRKDRDYDLTIKEHREKRSLDANAYAWVLIHKLAAAMRIKPMEVYREAVLNVGDNYTPMCVLEKDLERHRRVWESNGDGWQCIDRGPSNVPGCRTVFAYYGSHVFDTKQMSRLIDGLIQDCKALDIETLPPDKLAAMVGEWDA